MLERKKERKKEQKERKKERKSVYVTSGRENSGALKYVTYKAHMCYT